MRFVDLRRLAAATVVLGALLLPLYFLVLQPENALEPGFSNAALIDTPPVAGQQKVGLKVGELAPNFEISISDGGRITLVDLRGKPVLITFFALWCGSCLSEMPDIKALHEQRGVDSFSVLAINAGESRERAMEFIDFIKAPFIWALDFDLTVSDAYAVQGLPHTVYIDASGIVRAVYAGQAEKARLNAYVDAAFQASQPPEFGFNLRLLSSIPRERTLLVEYSEPGSVSFTSKSLRCDPGYCADKVMTNLKMISGVRSVRAVTNGGVPALEVHFDEKALAPETIVDAVLGSLDTTNDPLYNTRLTVSYSNR